MPTCRLSIAVALAVWAALTVRASAQDDPEVACVEAARSAGHLPPGTPFSAVSGVDRTGRAFVRVTWAAAGTGDRRWRAYLCRFEAGRLIEHAPTSPPVTGAAPSTGDAARPRAGA